MNDQLLIALLKDEVLPATGCTEPGAVALAAAYAAEALQAEPEQIRVSVNSNIYKNGVAVGIPGTGQTGLHIAAALGALKKQPQRQLSVLEGVTAAELKQANALLRRNAVSVSVDESKAGLWIDLRMTAQAGQARVVIEGSHTNVVLIEADGRNLLDRRQASAQDKPDSRLILRGDIRIADLVRAVEALPADQIDFLLDGVSMNLAAAEAGIAGKLGMGIGASYDEMVKTGLLAEDVVIAAKKLTAAAADARMSGENIQIMSSAGSGNHGITVILPVYAVARQVNAPRERLARALALSHLVTIYIKIHTGNLSALCGCAVAAATGATAAIAWLLDGDIPAIEASMKNVIANLTGMICDGGKVGCALKLSTAAATAVESALLALRQVVVPSDNGIIADTVERTVENLGKVSNPGMLETDKIILNVMLTNNQEEKTDAN
ncbi:MAG: L-serine ammonia-lyase, iron-sulfur-dependent, subunit alpha [Sporomusaceae bacterium]|nr:L-serine ammonia-lyase, iron-sulfur-dependent, subunit alpha [Sporomusaceae bacterium]